MKKKLALRKETISDLLPKVVGGKRTDGCVPLTTDCQGSNLGSCDSCFACTVSN